MHGAKVKRLYFVTLSDNSHLTAGRAVLVAVPFCRKPGSTLFSSVYCN